MLTVAVFPDVTLTPEALPLAMTLPDASRPLTVKVHAPTARLDTAKDDEDWAVAARVAVPGPVPATL